MVIAYDGKAIQYWILISRGQATNEKSFIVTGIYTFY